MKNKLLLFACVSAIALGACSKAKEELGLTKQAPDEFAVVKRAPLAMPPDYALRPPRPGAPRPQELSPTETAKQTVFGLSGTAPAQQEQGEEISSGPDSAFLAKAGNSDPSIRQKVDSETSATASAKRPVYKKLLGLAGVGENGEGATVVDPKQEAARLDKNKKTGQPVTKGETPTIEE